MAQVQTPIPDAIRTVRDLINQLNDAVAKYRAEGLTFEYVSDPAFNGRLHFHAPVGRHALP